eukprot:scaffold114275_cov63-Phaeocystis_antarctica.AAC.1
MTHARASRTAEAELLVHLLAAHAVLRDAHLATVRPTSSSVAYLVGSSAWATTPGQEQSMQSSRLCCEAYLMLP